jgi:hypothetical protein
VWGLLFCAKHLLIAAKYRLAALNRAPRCNNHPHLRVVRRLFIFEEVAKSLGIGTGRVQRIANELR